MNIALTQAELGEAMRRLAAYEGHKPTVFADPPIGKAGNPRVEARRKLARQMDSEGVPRPTILERLGALGYNVSMSTLKHDLNKTL